MKKLTATICLIIAVLSGSVWGGGRADSQKGLTAAQSGDCAIALLEWPPLAVKGNASASLSFERVDHEREVYRLSVEAALTQTRGLR